MFLGEPVRPESDPPWTATALRWIGAAASVVAAIAASQPWVQVRYPRVWGQAEGLPGWQEPAGFTCLIASAFTLVLSLLETRAPATRRAVQPGLLSMAVIAGVAVSIRTWQGPGLWRGVTAAFTAWHYLALGAAALAALTATVRWRVLRRAGLL